MTKSDRVVNWFVRAFVQTSGAVEVFYLRALRNSCHTMLVESHKNSVRDDETISSTFKQTIHYMGGSEVLFQTCPSLQGKYEMGQNFCMPIPTRLDCGSWRMVRRK